ncbi:MAG TPA: HAMP domain-containing sensor histidine kinase, partial [Herpetosiphonaceae bacterium]|nr:HAMP domain-containing sensor histidine kinase [Herpetosiphonaceae bacterium]
MKRNDFAERIASLRQRTAMLQEHVADAPAQEQLLLAGMLADFQSAIDELAGSVPEQPEYPALVDVSDEPGSGGTAAAMGQAEPDRLFGALLETAPVRSRDGELLGAGALAMEQIARKRAEEELRARDEFLSVVSHELKTPLTTLLGYADALKRRAMRAEPYLLDERDRRTLQIIINQSHRLNLLIESLLDVTRIGDGRLAIDLQPLDLCELAQQTVAELRPTLTKHTVELICGAGPLVVNGDRLRLEQALQNLLQNAIKYSPGGGQITVCVEHQGGHVALIVRDQGIGIPAAA